MTPPAQPTFNLTCPRDGATMEQVAAAGVTVDRCPACGAMWFDRKELQRLASDKAGARLVDQPLDRPAPEVIPGDIRCPRDHSRLIPVADRKQAHVEMLSCTSCGGLLLDAGELRDLSEFTLAERIRALFH